jgi:hypothetical protein
MSDVKVVLCLTKHYAFNIVWRVELYLHVPASQHRRVEPLVSIRQEAGLASHASVDGRCGNK